MAKINGIVINGFKAFPSLHTIELEGKHLLMYGENGSGKSSIYYALHCIFNSYRKPDKGKKYFDKSNSQNLVNRFFSPKDASDKPYVAVNWFDGGRNVFCLQYLNMVVMVLIGYQNLKHISLIINF